MKKSFLPFLIIAAMTLSGCAASMNNHHQDSSAMGRPRAIPTGMVTDYMDRYELELQQFAAMRDAAMVQRQNNTLAVTFKSDMFFDSESTALKPGAYEEIERIAQIINKHPETMVAVHGHTDSNGSEARNLDLSEKRAAAVCNSLIAKGVLPARITTQGFGEQYPLMSNATERGRQLNRRVGIIITPVEG